MLEQSALPANADNHKLYFAYGSNLSSTQMAQRCPNSIAVGLASLPGWDWIINERRYANIVRCAAPSPNVSQSAKEQEEAVHPGVYGILYRLPPHDEVILDRYEGVPWAYEKVILDVWVARKGAEREKVQALVYVDFNNVKPGTPWTEYVERMSRGVKEACEQWEFPAWFAETVMRRFLPGLKW